MSVKVNSNFSLVVSNDDFIILIDNDIGASVTNDAHNVITWLVDHFSGSLGGRRVYYRDTSGTYDELQHVNGAFTTYAACPEHVREALAAMVTKQKRGVA